MARVGSMNIPCLVRDGAWLHCREPLTESLGDVPAGTARTAAKLGRGRLSVSRHPPADAGSDRAHHTAEAGESR
jgi:hypothetical protein